MVGRRAGLQARIDELDLDASDCLVNGIAFLRQCLGRLANWNFDIEKGPLLKVFVIRETAQRHTLLLLTHHMISDAWSSGVLFRDLMKFYAALGRGSRPGLPELPVQYADYAVWQRDWLAGPELQRQLEYWQRALQGAAPLLELPTDRPRPARQTYRGSRWALHVDSALLQALRALAVGQSATLYMVLLSAFYILLSRYAGQRDVVVGSPIAGRQRTELENLVGFFANTLALRADCDPQLSFNEFLQQVRQLSLESFAHQDLPFERLVEALQPARRLSHAPIFQVMFVLQNAPWEAETIDELSFSPAEMAPGDSSKYDLTLSVAEADDGLWASFEYSTDLFDAMTMQRFASAYDSLLRAIVENPACTLLDLPLQQAGLLQAEQAAWNDTAEADFAAADLAAHAGSLPPVVPGAVGMSARSRRRRACGNAPVPRSRVAGSRCGGDRGPAGPLGPDDGGLLTGRRRPARADRQAACWRTCWHARRSRSTPTRRRPWPGTDSTTGRSVSP